MSGYYFYLYTVWFYTRRPTLLMETPFIPSPSISSALSSRTFHHDRKHSPNRRY